MKTTATNRKLRQLLTGIRGGTLIPRPEFQRRLVWANKHKIAFLHTVLQNYPFPEIYLAAGDVNPDSGEGTEMLVDGQQRITTLYQYFTGSPDLQLPKDLPAYSELMKEQKLAFLEYEVVVRDLGKMSIVEIKEIFKRINSTNYALNAMEISNARYEGELKSFAERLAQHHFFEAHAVFSATELRRMHDLRFVLTVTITMLGSYFNRDDELEMCLELYNDEFSQADAISGRVNSVLEFMEKLSFPPKNRVWKKSDLFTLLVELDRSLYRHKKELDVAMIRGNLLPFYDLIDRLEEVEDADPLLLQYHKASLQATNDRINRIRRGEVVQLILGHTTDIDWEEWSTNAGSEVIQQMVDWFFENYKDPADGVPYDGGEGGYQYINGGPYKAGEELRENFENVPEYLIEHAAKQINASGWEWVKKDEY
jgi:hypothetical protein